MIVKLTLMRKKSKRQNTLKLDPDHKLLQAVPSSSGTLAHDCAIGHDRAICLHKRLQGGLLEKRHRHHKNDAAGCLVLKGEKLLGGGLDWVVEADGHLKHG